jgi:hypothetical protein
VLRRKSNKVSPTATYHPPINFSAELARMIQSGVCYDPNGNFLRSQLKNKSSSLAGKFPFILCLQRFPKKKFAGEEKTFIKSLLLYLYTKWKQRKSIKKVSMAPDALKGKRKLYPRKRRMEKLCVRGEIERKFFFPR